MNRRDSNDRWERKNDQGPGDQIDRFSRTQLCAETASEFASLTMPDRFTNSVFNNEGAGLDFDTSRVLGHVDSRIHAGPARREPHRGEPGERPNSDVAGE